MSNKNYLELDAEDTNEEEIKCCGKRPRIALLRSRKFWKTISSIIDKFFTYGIYFIIVITIAYLEFSFVCSIDSVNVQNELVGCAWGEENGFINKFGIAFGWLLNITFCIFVIFMFICLIAFNWRFLKDTIRNSFIVEKLVNLCCLPDQEIQSQ